MTSTVALHSERYAVVKINHVRHFEGAVPLAALAAAKGQPSVAEAVLELISDVAGEFMHWFFERDAAQ
jgi:hypothetical protein